MKLDIQGIKVIRGEFAVHDAVTAGLSPPGSERAQLVVGCQYGLIDKKGIVVAQGTASNSPTASAQSITLSESTLKAFQTFFTYLEHDIASALESTSDEDAERKNLEKILAGSRT